MKTNTKDIRNAKASLQVTRILNLAVAALLALSVSTGCSKKQEEVKWPEGRPKFDVAKFQAAFQNPAIEIRKGVYEVTKDLRYGAPMYDTTLMELSKLASLPDVTAEQKQAIAELAAAVEKG